MVMFSTDSFPPAKMVTFPALQREISLVKRTPFIGTPIWLVFERNGQAEPQQVAWFENFNFACACFDDRTKAAENEN